MAPAARTGGGGGRPGMSDACVVLTTTATEEEAQALSRALVQNRLAACVQRLRVASGYGGGGVQAERRRPQPRGLAAESTALWRQPDSADVRTGRPIWGRQPERSGYWKLPRSMMFPVL